MQKQSGEQTEWKNVSWDNIILCIIPAAAAAAACVTIVVVALWARSEPASVTSYLVLKW